MPRKTIYIYGMTCLSCETIIKDELGEMEGISAIKIDHKRGDAEIQYEERVDFDEVLSRINKLGYNAALRKEDLIKTKKSRAKVSEWMAALAIVIGLYVVYKLLIRLGFLDWAHDVDAGNVSYGAAMLIGLIASISTCLAVVGAVIVSFSAKYQSKGTFYEANIKPHLLFHVGRLATFFVLGGLLGLIGDWLNFSNVFMGWFTILVAIVLIWLGLSIIGLVPSMTKLGIHAPKKSLLWWEKMKASEHALAPIVLGGITFFLPCGFTQSMQLFAVSTGSFISGALIMFIFALGTLPVLASLGIVATRCKNMRTIVLEKTIGMIVILFAVYTFVAGSALAGVNISLPVSGEVKNVQVVSGKQAIEMVVDYNGFTPNVFRLQVGVPVEWVIMGDQLTGCNNEIIVPSLNIDKKLSPGKNIIEFTPKNQGTINFSCWMGMIRGKFIVE